MTRLSLPANVAHTKDHPVYPPFAAAASWKRLHVEAKIGLPLSWASCNEILAQKRMRI